jgi:hypothetical protein
MGRRTVNGGLDKESSRTEQYTCKRPASVSLFDNTIFQYIAPPEDHPNKKCKRCESLDVVTVVKYIPAYDLVFKCGGQLEAIQWTARDREYAKCADYLQRASESYCMFPIWDVPEISLTCTLTFNTGAILSVGKHTGGAIIPVKLCFMKRADVISDIPRETYANMVSTAEHRSQTLSPEMLDVFSQVLNKDAAGHPEVVQVVDIYKLIALQYVTGSLKMLSVIKTICEQARTM